MMEYFYFLLLKSVTTSFSHAIFSLLELPVGDIHTKSRDTCQCYYAPLTQSTKLPFRNSFLVYSKGWRRSKNWVRIIMNRNFAWKVFQNPNCSTLFFAHNEFECLQTTIFSVSFTITFAYIFHCSGSNILLFYQDLTDFPWTKQISALCTFFCYKQPYSWLSYIQVSR